VTPNAAAEARDGRYSIGDPDRHREGAGDGAAQSQVSAQSRSVAITS